MLYKSKGRVSKPYLLRASLLGIMNFLMKKCPLSFIIQLCKYFYLKIMKEYKNNNKFKLEEEYFNLLLLRMKN